MTYVVTGNEVEMENGNAAFALGSSIPVAILKDAVISNNRISGMAEYGVLSLDGAQNCTIADNDMADFTPSVANVGLYGENTHDNQVTGAAGVYVEADRTHDNTVTGYTRNCRQRKISSWTHSGKARSGVDPFRMTVGASLCAGGGAA